jgi:Nif-specific regulatory protein
LSLLHMTTIDPSDPSRVLLPVGNLLGLEVNLDEVLHTLVDRIAASLQADRGTLYLVDSSRDELFSRAAHLPELKQIRLKLGQGIAGDVARRGVPVNIPTARDERRFNPDIDKLTGYQTSSLLAVPLRDSKGEVFGVIQVLNKRGQGTFDADDEHRLEQMAAEVAKGLEGTSLYTELRRARAVPQQPVGYFFNRVIGESAPMQAIYKVIQKAAQTDATVLLRGESGTGKELVARAVHVNSPRRDKPFVKVDCAALPGSLIENELFGHEKGAFTGADTRQTGKFEAADGGTVFIDELGELPLPVQGKLLRVLQDREFDRVGGTTPVRVSVRIVAATHRDLAAMVREGRFREDLYYRIKVVEVGLPSLRARGAEDIERLTRHFVAQASKRHHLAAEPVLTRSALERLVAWHWPGNVRELENCIESAVVLCDGEVRVEHLPLADLKPGSAPAPVRADAPIATLAEVERAHVLAVLERAKGNRTQAAKWLGIGRNTLGRRLREYGITGDDE